MLILPRMRQKFPCEARFLIVYRDRVVTIESQRRRRRRLKFHYLFVRDRHRRKVRSANLSKNRALRNDGTFRRYTEILVCTVLVRPRADLSRTSCAEFRARWKNIAATLWR